MSASGNFSSINDGAVMHSEFMAFIGDEESVNSVRASAEKQGFPAAAVQSGGPDMLADMLAVAAAPRIIVVDVDGQTDSVASAARLVSLCGPTSKIIVVGSANDVSLYRRMLSAGVVDYLVKPLTAEQLTQTMTVAMREKPAVAANKENKIAKIVVIIGVRGGVGASTVAINCGWLLAHKLNSNCALLDLDLQYGTSALALDLEPGRGLRDVISSPQRVDSLLIASSMVAESDQFSVLGAEEAVDEPVLMDGDAVTALLKEMSPSFDFIIIDMPRHVIAGQKRLLVAAHDFVIVTELSLAGIRDTLRIKNALKALNSSAKIILVGACVGPAHSAQVDTAAFEKSVQMKLNLILPEDHKTAAEAANAGKAICALASHTPLAKALIALASQISGKEITADVEKKTGFWGKKSKPNPKQPEKPAPKEKK